MPARPPPAGRHKFQSSPGSREPGVLSRPRRLDRYRGFNPRPAHVSRASASSRSCLAHSCCFNPRPAHVSRASASGQILDLAPLVSILARRLHDNALGLGFNPRPAHVSRASAAIAVLVLLVSRFNPRPAHVSRASGARPRRCRYRHCFNPRPAHVSRASSGRPSLMTLASLFQSSPGSREPGVVERCGRCVALPHVSILARLT